MLTLDTLSSQTVSLRVLAALIAGLLAGAGFALAYDGPFELAPLAIAMVVIAVWSARTDGETA